MKTLKTERIQTLDEEDFVLLDIVEPESSLEYDFELPDKGSILKISSALKGEALLDKGQVQLLIRALSRMVENL